MKIKKILLGFALGIALLAGISGSVNVKAASSITVKVDKADQSTAKKVDAALKKGKVVKLKVKGNMKTSRKRLIQLQAEVGKYNVYNIRFRLSNETSIANKFDYDPYKPYDPVCKSYRTLKYKQSGMYGVYTLAKGCCNAYKYCYEMTDRYFKQTVLDEYSEENYLQKKLEFARERMADELDDIVQKEYKNYVSELPWYMSQLCRGIADIRCNVQPRDDGTMEELKSRWMIEPDDGQRALIDRLFEVSQTLDVSVPSYHDWVESETNKSVADYLSGKSTYIRHMYLGFLSNGKIPRMSYDNDINFKWKIAKNPLRGYPSENAKIIRGMLKGTAKGVCADLALMDRELLNYFGIKSWYISNMSADHAVCVTSSLASEKAYGEDNERLWVFDNGTVKSFTDNKKYRFAGCTSVKLFK